MLHTHGQSSFTDCLFSTSYISMNISYNEQSRVFSLDTENTGYYIGIVDKENFVGHIHYGKKLSAADNIFSLLRTGENPKVPSENERERLSFYDCLPCEYPCGGIGDFRESCLNVKNSKGESAVVLHYVSRSEEHTSELQS